MMIKPTILSGPMVLGDSIPRMNIIAIPHVRTQKIILRFSLPWSQDPCILSTPYLSLPKTQVLGIKGLWFIKTGKRGIFGPVNVLY